MQTIFPILRYADARAAIRWLCEAFGFVQVFVVPESGPIVRHAQLRLGTNIIMVGSVRPDDGLTSPAACSVATQALSVYVPDVDALYQRLVAARVRISGPPETTDFGSRQFSVRDLEGHPWVFGNYLPQLSPTSPS